MERMLSVLIVLPLFWSIPAVSEEIKVEGFMKVEDVKSSRSDLPIPVIPKDWKFIGVSNGAKMNSNNLWFQDKEGNVYMLQGASDTINFVLFPIISRIPRK